VCDAMLLPKLTGMKMMSPGFNSRSGLFA